jgi:nucleotide-binding universal stress UspA family protein
MKTIIVATDFSKAAKNATSYAADMAMAINADIILLHVFQISIGYMEIPLAANVDELMSDSKKSLAVLKEKLLIRTRGEVSIKIEIVAGVFFPELEALCEKKKPYAVIMGSQGTTAADHVFYGRHTVYAMKHLMWPLITVPLEASYSQIKKICLACDFDEVIESTPIDEIIRLVNDLHAELHVINSGKETSPDPEMVFESGMLHEMLVSVNPQYHFIVDENAEESIINFVEKNNIDLLITLPKKRDLLKQLIHKSFSKKMILQSQVPVLALHSPIE